MLNDGSDIGETLTTGIQNVSALLPIIGTEQCEKHVGSALEGGYIYAASTPLSIFGSLGIVKSGISVLISSISLPLPVLSIANFKLPRPSIRSSRRRWLGARALDNAGFKPMGTVAPMVGMDESHFKAETRLLQILEEKHIDNPARVSINWRTRGWNANLVFYTLIAAAVSITPYIHLISSHGSASLLVPWTFPLLRTVGSCIAVVCSQLLLQSRIISLMKSRVIFTVMNHALIDELKECGVENPESTLSRQNDFQWNPDLPAEESLWSLQQYLRCRVRDSTVLFDTARPSNDVDNKSISAGSEATIVAATHITMQPFSDPEHLLCTFSNLQRFHFPSPHYDFILAFAISILLFLSLPASIAGYVGCFTLVSSNTSSNGPLIWLGLEAALSIIRILLWASNPSFDENTEVTVEVELSDIPPLVTTSMDTEVLEENGNILNLVSESRFLELITPYTGPLYHFPAPANTVLYFTMTGTSVASNTEIAQKRLFIVVLDLRTRTGIALHLDGNSLVYSNALVTRRLDGGDMQAELQPRTKLAHRQRWNQVEYFERLASYYHFILHALSEPPEDRRAILRWKWTLSEPEISNRFERRLDLLPFILRSPALSSVDRRYLELGFEYNVKAKLIQNWCRWIMKEAEAQAFHGRAACYHLLDQPTSEEATWELSELSDQLHLELLRSAMVLLELSMHLENTLRLRLLGFIKAVTSERIYPKLAEWSLSEFELEQRKRLLSESQLAKRTIDTARQTMNQGSEELEGWLLKGDQHFKSRHRTIEKLWMNWIGDQGACDGDPHLDWLRPMLSERPIWEDTRKEALVKELRVRISSWKHHSRRDDMKNTVERIRNAAFSELTNVYSYQEPSSRLASAIHSQFLDLSRQSGLTPSEKAFAVKHSSAIAADLQDCGFDLICSAIQRSTCRSVLDVDETLVPEAKEIPHNNHLLYIGYLEKDASPAFALQNRALWWQESERYATNASLWYPTAKGIPNADGQCVCSENALVARIMIYIQTSVHPRLRLVHSHGSGAKASISILQAGKEVCLIRKEEIPEGRLGVLDVKLGLLEQGRHELEVFVRKGEYLLRDIILDLSIETRLHPVD